MIKKSKIIREQFNILSSCIKRSTLEEKLKNNLANEIQSLEIDLQLRDQTRKGWKYDIEILHKRLNQALKPLPDTDIWGKRALHDINNWIDSWIQHTKT